MTPKNVLCKGLFFRKARDRSVESLEVIDDPIVLDEIGRAIKSQDAAAKWLMERRDLAERRETIGMIMNAALLVFIAWTILLGVINLFRGVH
jgi:hypothetical protein